MLTLFKPTLFDDFDRMFDFYPNSFNQSPQVKVDKNENDYVVQMSVPGLTKDDLDISVKDGMITISHTKEEKDENHYFVSSFTKTYTLPDNIDEDKIEGKVENGILSLKLPLDVKKTKQKLIELS